MRELHLLWSQRLQDVPVAGGRMPTRSTRVVLVRPQPGGCSTAEQSTRLSSSAPNPGPKQLPSCPESLSVAGVRVGPMTTLAIAGHGEQADPIAEAQARGA